MGFVKGLLWPACLGCSIGLAGATSYIATFDRPWSVDPTPALLAMLITFFGFSPPKSILRLISNGVAYQLFFIVWHLGVFLPAIILLTAWEGDERKCFVNALLACYFVALPLESGRRIRLAKLEPSPPRDNSSAGAKSDDHESNRRTR